MQSTFSFDEATFNRLFPFYLLINWELEVIAMGRSLSKLYEIKEKDLLKNHFSIPRPYTPLEHAESLVELNNQMVILEPTSTNKPKLRGQLEVFKNSNEILFVGSPWFDSMEQVLQNKLLIDDFARHDPMIDLLHVLQSQEITTNDLKDLLSTVNNQKEKLKIAYQEISDIALFPTQNPDPLLRININGEILRMNPAAENLTSYTYNNKNYSPEIFWKITSASFNPSEKRNIVEVVSEGRIYSFVVVPIPQSGYYNIYGRDITEQKKIQTELEIQSNVASANENGVVLTDEEGVIIWCNEGMKKITRSEREDIIGKTPVELLAGPLTDKNEIQKMLDAFNNNRSFRHELIQYRADGSWYWGRTKGQYIQRSDGSKNYFAIIEDVTEQKQQEQQIRILSSIAAENTHGVVIADAEGKIEWVNKSFERITGYTLLEIKGKKPGHLLQGADTDPQSIAYLREQINKGEPFITEILNYSKSKTPYWLRIQGQALKNSEGQIIKYFAIEEDITAERESKQKIKEFEAKLRMALEGVGDYVWEYDFSKNKSRFSKKENHFLGIENTSKIELNIEWWNSVHPDDKHILENGDRLCRSGKTSDHSLEYRIVDKYGKVRWVLDRGVVIEKDEKGLPLLMLGTHTDITSRKNAEDQLELQRRFYEEILDNIPSDIAVFDKEHRYLYVNPMGIKNEEIRKWIIGKTDKEYLIYRNKPLSLLESRNKYFEKVLLSKQQHSWEEELTQPDGSTKYILRNLYPVMNKDEELIQIIGYGVDITERKKFEMALKANEEKYRGIIANMNLGMIEIDLNQKVTFANQSMAVMVDAPLEKVIGVDTNSFLPQDSFEQVQHKLKERWEGKSEAFELKVQIKGKEKWWLVSSAPRFNEKREFVGTIVICLDINEQKQLESELRIARIQAEHLAQVKQNFLANMSHEIRTPMNAIIGMGNQLAKTKLNHKQNFFLKAINDSAENLLVIINDILDLSKIEAGKLTVEKIGFKPKTVIGAAIQALMYKAEEKGLKITNSFYDQNLAEVFIGDPYRLNQVLLNLISNALKFTENGNVDIVCKVLRETANTQTIEGSVIDTGIGMEQEFISTLFDKFTQEYESVSRKYGGSGLGMSITKELVELMGGQIEVTSEKGKGTTIRFVIEFKKGTLDDLPVSKSYHISNDVLRGKRILITDDNEMNRLVALTILESYGAEIFEASNGEKAINAIKESKPDLILMDIQMPILNGYKASMQIRNLGYTMPIVALTANAIKGESEVCKAAGMNDYISKPFKEEELLKMIAFWLNTELLIEEKTTYDSNIPNTLTIHYDLTKLKAIGKGNDSFINKMLHLFIKQGPLTINEIKQAYEINDFEKIKKLAHRLKPSIDNMGIVSITAAIRDMEKNAIAYGKSDQLYTLINQVETVVETVIGEIKEYLSLQSN